MALIIEKPGTKNECVIALPVGRVEKLQVKTGKYRWNLNIEEGTVSLMDLLLNANAHDAKEIREALLQFEEYLKHDEPVKDAEDAKC